MSAEQGFQASYFVRRVTADLLNQMAPEGYPQAQGASDSTGLSTIWDGLVKVGLGVGEIFGLTLSSKNPRESIKLRKKNPNTYGFFLVEIGSDGRVVGVQTNFKKAPDAKSQVYLIADFLGTPLLKLTGEVAKSFLDTSPGQWTDTQYAIDMWLDPGITAWVPNGVTNPEGDKQTREQQDFERIGRFLQLFMHGRDDLTIEEFVSLAKIQLDPFIQSNLTLDKLKNRNGSAVDAIEAFSSQVVSRTGLTTVVHFKPAGRVFKHQITINDETVEATAAYSADNQSDFSREGGYLRWFCRNCPEGDYVDSEYGFKTTVNPGEAAFCSNCGKPKPSGVANNQHKTFASDKVKRLVSNDGDELVFDLSFASYGQENINTDAIALKCIEVLRPICRRFPLISFEDPQVISNIANRLNEELGTAVYGNIGEFAVVDFRSIDADWRLQSRARQKQIAREVDSVSLESEGELLRIVALQEARIAKLKRVNELDFNEQSLVDASSLANLKRLNEFNFNEQSLDATSRVQSKRLDVTTDIEIQRIERERQKEENRLKQEAEREKRENEMSEVDYDLSSQDKVFDHDLIRDKKILEHKISQDQAEKSAKLAFEEHAARLTAARNIDIARQDQDLELDAKRQAQNIELEKVKLEEELKLRKLQAMAEIERQQKEAYKGLSAAQILAMQASDLASNGAGDALSKLAGADADVARAQAEAEAKLAREKSELYEKFLQMQERTMQSAMDSQKASSDKVNQAHEKSVEIATRLSESSINAQSNVATAASEMRSTQNINVDVKAAQLKCSKCSHDVPSNSKFCPNCGNAMQS